MRLIDLLTEEKAKIYYHVTPYENLKSIKSKGLIPQLGQRSSAMNIEHVGVFCFKSIEDVEDALMNWLGDEFDDDTQLAILKIIGKGLEAPVEENNMYEVRFASKIPPENIKVVSKDADSYFS
jgi:hypothetical protein